MTCDRDERIVGQHATGRTATESVEGAGRTRLNDLRLRGGLGGGVIGLGDDGDDGSGCGVARVLVSEDGLLSHSVWAAVINGDLADPAGAVCESTATGVGGVAEADTSVALLLAIPFLGDAMHFLGSVNVSILAIVGEGTEGLLAYGRGGVRRGVAGGE